MITCGGQATIPIVAAVTRVAPVPYAEIVSHGRLAIGRPGHARQHRRVHRDHGARPRDDRRRRPRQGDHRPQPGRAARSSCATPSTARSARAPTATPSRRASAAMVGRGRGLRARLPTSRAAGLRRWAVRTRRAGSPPARVTVFLEVTGQRRLPAAVRGQPRHHDGLGGARRRDRWPHERFGATPTPGTAA